MGPDALDDYTEVVQLARRGCSLYSTDLSLKQALGIALFRAGLFEEALESLTESATAPEITSITPLYSRFFVAMAHDKLGRATEAREWYERASAETECMLDDGRTEAGGLLSWNRRLMLQRLRDEARQLIKP